ncbi:chalcone isomerase family protein [Cobetia sp. D5]|uniref:chalcone isomerase family protein n=1 Tax=Cobetia sp. D5 TaxID=3105867 RepID=UPI002D788620|nr:chalcone isomerase family protein [Cobetia sp. D5]
MPISPLYRLSVSAVRGAACSLNAALRVVSLPVASAPRWLAAGVMGALLATSSPAALAVEIKGVTFADQVATQSGQPLTLIGSGLFTYLLWDAYVGAYYQDARRPRPAPLKDVSRRLVLEYFHAIDAEDFAKATTKGVRKNLSAADFAAIEPELTRFNRAYQDVVPGDRYALQWLSAGGGRGTLSLVLNGQVIFESDSLALANGLFAIWLGDEPAQQDFRTQLLGQ